MKKSEKQYPLRLPQIVYEGIQVLAKLHNRSVNKEIIHVIQQTIIYHAEEISNYLDQQKKENI